MVCLYFQTILCSVPERTIMFDVILKNTLTTAIYFRGTWKICIVIHCMMGENITKIFMYIHKHVYDYTTEPMRMPSISVWAKLKSNRWSLTPVRSCFGTTGRVKCYLPTWWAIQCKTIIATFLIGSCALETVR